MANPEVIKIPALSPNSVLAPFVALKEPIWPVFITADEPLKVAFEIVTPDRRDKFVQIVEGQTKR